jgi:hypothetical protein
MLAALTVLAQTSAESQGEPSKVAFYIAGGLLVAFALVVSAIGIRGETFPPSRGGRALVMAVAVVLAAAAMATAVLTA